MSASRAIGAALGLCPLAVAWLGLGGCGSDGEDENVPSSPQGVWLFDDSEGDAVFGSNVSCSEDPVIDASLAIEDGQATFSVQTDDCGLGPQEGPVAEGKDGFIVGLTNRYSETSTLTCIGDGPSAYLCEHSWLDGEFRMTRL